MSDNLNELRTDITKVMAKLNDLQKRYVRLTGHRYIQPAPAQMRPGRMLAEFFDEIGLSEINKPLE